MDVLTERKITKGPPPKDGVRRANWTTRLRHDLRAKLMAEAESRNLSMSEVVEDIIKAHFDQPALIDALADRLEQRRADRAEINKYVNIFKASGTFDMKCSCGRPAREKCPQSVCYRYREQVRATAITEG